MNSVAERNFKSDDQDDAMDRAQNKAEEAMLLDPDPVDDEPADVEADPFRHFTDPNADMARGGWL